MKLAIRIFSFVTVFFLIHKSISNKYLSLQSILSNFVHLYNFLHFIETSHHRIHCLFSFELGLSRILLCDFGFSKNLLFYFRKNETGGVCVDRCVWTKMIGKSRKCFFFRKNIARPCIARLQRFNWKKKERKGN